MRVEKFDCNISLSTEMQMITFYYLPTFNLKHFTIYRLLKCKYEGRFKNLPFFDII